MVAAGSLWYIQAPRHGNPAVGHPVRSKIMEISIGEVLYLVLVVAVAWWAYDMLKDYL